MCVPFLLSHVFQRVKAGSTMVPVWALTIAFMNGSERGGSDGERQKGATGSALCSGLSFFWDVSHFIKPFCFPFIYLLKGLKGTTSCFVAPAGVKWQQIGFNPDKLMLKVDSESSEGECGIALPMQGRAWLKRREGCDITLYPLSYWVLGEKVGERLRGVRGGEWMWESRDLFSEVDSLPGGRWSGLSEGGWNEQF